MIDAWMLALAILITFFIVFFSVGLTQNKADWGFFVTNAFDGWIRVFCRRYHRLISSYAAVPEEGGAIVVANHMSGLDPLLLIASCKRPLRFLIAKEEYERFGLQWVFRLAKCIPVDRGGRVDKAFREAIRAVNNGEIVALFPHGKIHLDDEEKVAIKPGLRKLAQKLNCSVYPARLEGVRSPGSVFVGVICRGHTSLKWLPPVEHEAFLSSSIDHTLGAMLLNKHISQSSDT